MVNYEENILYRFIKVAYYLVLLFFIICSFYFAYIAKENYNQSSFGSSGDNLIMLFEVAIEGAVYSAISWLVITVIREVLLYILWGKKMFIYETGNK